MPNCMICKRSAYSGYVICSDCAKTLKADSLSLELEFVLEQLAEEIASSEDIYACRYTRPTGRVYPVPAFRRAKKSRDEPGQPGCIIIRGW